METSKLIELTFVEWKASLASRDRTRKSIRPNFEELFEKWNSLGAKFDDLYESYLPKAVKAHLPAPATARNTYKKLKATIPHFDKTEKEYIDEWFKSIEDIATESFFEFFSPPALDQDDEPKIYGNMSATEYKAQRRYADQFPTLDTTELEKQWNEQKYNFDVEDLLKNVLGEKE